MKLLEHFREFLSDHVNLNKTRIELLEGSVEAVKTAVRDADWGAEVVAFAAQGSWAHGTIIKPQPGDEFDADLLVMVRDKDGWEPKDYINKLASALQAISTYRDKIHRYSHCITIEYQGERRIDVAPCVQDREYFGQREVCNRNSNQFERSEPIAYTEWVVSKNAVAGGNDLKKVARLLKYMRDIKGNFTCPSFLLTTLLGYRINDYERDSLEFVDLPTTLKTLVGRLDDWLQSNPNQPIVLNPVLRQEVQSSGWNSTTYASFRDKIHLYRRWIDEAFEETDRDESIRKWQKVFGDNFGRPKVTEAAQAANMTAASTSAFSWISEAVNELVDRVRQVGGSVIPSWFSRPPHLQPEPAIWVPDRDRYTVVIRAELLSAQGSRIRLIESAEPLGTGLKIRFNAVGKTGGAFPASEFNVQWRVTNTGPFAVHQLRGGFYSSDAGMSRTEALEFRGVHFVEAFLLRKGSNRLAGRSEVFYVVVE